MPSKAAIKVGGKFILKVHLVMPFLLHAAPVYYLFYKWGIADVIYCKLKMTAFGVDRKILNCWVNDQCNIVVVSSISNID